MADSSSAASRRPAVLGGSPRFAQPLFVTRPRVPDRKAFGELCDRVFAARWFTNDGALVREFEERLRSLLGVGFCAAFCNATIGLLAALRSLRLHGEVVTTPFTFPATVHAIEWTGLTPVFADIDPETYNLDPASVAERLSDHTSAVLPVHVFGNPCDVRAFEAMAGQRGLKIVYDAAHAFTVHCHGKPIGCWGDLSVFSFHATKLFHTAEGGAVVGSDDELAAAIRSLRNFGIVNEEVVRGVGVNGKLSELHAAVGLSLLPQLEEEIDLRGRLTAHYLERLGQVEGLRCHRVDPQSTPNYGYFVVDVDAASFGLSRNQLHHALRAENVITRKYFYPLCSENEAYRHLPTARAERLPNAHEVANRVLCLPLYSEMTADDVDAVADAILAIRAAAAEIRRLGDGG